MTTAYSDPTPAPHAERVPCIAELRRLRNPVVAAALAEWENGQLCNLEHALILAVKLLAEQNAKLTQELFANRQKLPTVPYPDDGD